MSCLAPLTLTSGATGDTFFSGKEERGGKITEQERDNMTQRTRGSASVTVTLWDDRVTGDA